MKKQPQTEAQIRAFCMKHFNDFVVIGRKAARLIGYARDDQGSSYLILQSPGRIYWYSAILPYKLAVKAELERISQEMLDANCGPAAEFDEVYGSRWRPL